LLCDGLICRPKIKEPGDETVVRPWARIANLTELRHCANDVVE
jgi:hypothetical protein